MWEIVNFVSIEVPPFLFAIIRIVLVQVKYFSQSKCDAEDSGCHLINNGLRVVKGEKKRQVWHMLNPFLSVQEEK